jgi:hypothetical protein
LLYFVERRRNRPDCAGVHGYLSILWLNKDVPVRVDPTLSLEFLAANR